MDEAEASPRPSSPLDPAAWLALALLSAVWAWWAWQQGAYFGVVLLPGGIVLCIGAALLVRFGQWRVNLRLSPGVLIALVALTALGCWALLSALWSPAPDIAIADGQRMLIYALCFGLGVGLCSLLGARMKLSLVPLAAAAAFAGLVTVISLATSGDPRDLLEMDGTLDFPLGYRNAEAAFFAIALFPAIGLASDRELDWRLRGAGLATATLCIELFLLAQSRASVPAMAVALTVYTLASPQRVRALSWLALALVPALGIMPALTSLYGAADGGLAGVVDEMHHAGVIAGLTVIASLGLGMLAARHERRLPGLGSDSSAGNRRVAYGMIVGALVLAIGFVVAVGDPVHWLSERADEFRNAGSPDLSDQSSRFSFNAGSDRYDAWRVALSDAGDDPVFGDGGGGFRYSYLIKREAQSQNLHDAHSVEMELLAEFGIVGLALFAIAIAGVANGVLRSRRLGPSAASLTAIALASGSYWLVHTSVDWFWPYPAVTAPALALLGSACAPAARALEPGARHAWRGWVITGLAVLAISAIPPWLSERYVNNAYAGWPSDLGRAYDDLDQARRANPLSDVPLLAEGAIARASGDRERALAAFREAAEKRPEEWAVHYLLAQLQAKTDLAAARNEIRVALELNPLGTRVQSLAERLGVDPETLSLSPR
ncbi:MAG TPA: O-antigen ligase family protein [Solirubrobacterales bacterium]